MALGGPTITMLEVDTTCSVVLSNLSYLTGPGHGVWENLVLKVQEALSDKIQEELRAPMDASRRGGFHAGPSRDWVGDTGSWSAGQAHVGLGDQEFSPMLAFC